MAYPLAKMPTLREWLNRVQQEFDCVVKSSPLLTEVIRETPTGTKQVPLPNDIPDNEVVSPDALIILCHRLDIPLEAFGFILDDDEGIKFGTYS